VKDAKSQAATDRYFARNEGDSVVARVNAGAVRAINKFLKNPSVLRDKTFAKFNPAAVDAIDVTANGETFELRRIGSEWKVYDADGSPRTANPAMVGTLVGRFLAKGLVTGFPDAAMSDDRKGLTKPAATVRVYENAIVQEKKAEGKEPEKTPAPAVKPKLAGTPVAVFDFGNKDVGDVVYARRTAGEVKADLFVPLELLTIVSKPRMEYLDASIKPFAADGVTRITFTRGKETFDIERADDKKPAAQATWKLNGPESMKGRAVDASKVFEMLNQIAFLKPARIAADRPKEDVLNRLEVNPATPRCKVTVKLAGAPDRVYDFGGDVGTEKKNVYLKSLEENLVFEVDRAPFDLIQKADVLDTVVHRIDVAKIKGFKVKGWSELLGSPTTIEVVRDKDGKWKLAAGGMFEVDPVKVDQLLTDLTAPKADSFVALKTGPKPEHNLDPAKNALEIDLDAEGGPVKIVLGSPKDGKIHATSSLLPGDVFLLTDKYNWLRAKPAALKKD
jgi:Domain of unknown function (DUF4340)